MMGFSREASGVDELFFEVGIAKSAPKAPLSRALLALKPGR
jgi:hypothetical protein